jgi:hypothetical protein
MADRQGSKAFRRAKKLAGSPNSTPIDLAQALWEAEAALPGSLKEIIFGTGVGRRKAYYLVKVWERFASFPKPRLAAIGWTKLTVIATHSQPGSEARALDLAEVTTVKDLERALQDGSSPGVAFKSVLLRLTPGQHRLFASALVKYGATKSTNGRGFANKEGALIRALRTLR